MQNLNHLVSLLQEGYSTIGVMFTAIERAPVNVKVENVPFPPPAEPWQPATNQKASIQSQRVYTYKCAFDCMPGDLVIVPPSSEGKLPSIATVVRVDAEPELNFESGIEYKWAVQKIDFTQYDHIQSKEKDMIKLLRDGERAQQRRKLLETYQMSLPDDAESRKIFDQVRQIGLTVKE